MTTNTTHIELKFDEDESDTVLVRWLDKSMQKKTTNT